MMENLRNTVARTVEKGKNSDRSVAYTGWIFDDGSSEASENTYCHAGLDNGGCFDNEILAVFSRWQNQKVTNKDDMVLFYDYMTKYSPWRETILNTSLEDVLEHGWLVNADYESNYVVNTCVATRLISEFPSRFLFFKKALDAGAEPNEAMILTQFCNDSDNSFYINHVDGHGFVYDVKDNIIKNFLTDNKQFSMGTYRETGTYNNHCKIWDGKKGDRYAYGDYKCTNILLKIPIQQNIKKVNLNIFYKEKKNVGQYHSYKTMKYFIESVKEKLVA